METFCRVSIAVMPKGGHQLRICHLCNMCGGAGPYLVALVQHWHGRSVVRAQDMLQLLEADAGKVFRVGNGYA